MNKSILYIAVVVILTVFISCKSQIIKLDDCDEEQKVEEYKNLFGNQAEFHNLWDHYNFCDTEFEKKYKDLDTVYFYIKNGNEYCSKEMRMVSPSNNYKCYECRYLFRKTKYSSYNYYRFESCNYINTKSKEPNTIIKKPISFLNDKKGVILTYKTFSEMSDKDIESFGRKFNSRIKVVFIINMNENTKDSITLRKAQFHSSYPIIQ